MDAAGLTAEVRQELIEGAAEVWTDAEILDYLNDGLSMIQSATEWKEEIVNLPVAAGSNNPTEEPTAEIRRLRRVTWDEAFLPQTSEFELDRWKSNWRDDANDKPSRWYFLNNQATVDNLRLYPGVNSATDATSDYSFNQETGRVASVVEDGVAWTFSANTGIIGTIVDTTDQQFYFRSEAPNPNYGKVGDMNEGIKGLGLWFVGEPSELINTTDTPEFPSWLHPSLVYYALFRCYDREGAFRDEPLAMTYLQEFMDWVSAINTVRNRQFPDRYLSLDAVKSATGFQARLSRLEGKF